MSIEKYNRLSEQVQKLASLPPDKQAEHFAKVNQPIVQVAPGIAPNLAAIGQNGLQFLHNKLPKPNAEFMGDDKWEPAKSQKATWSQYFDAVNDPIAALDHVKNGTLSGQHIEALSAVHPTLYNDMKQKVMENMTPKNMKGLNYGTKIALSKFLGMPTHGSLLPQVISADQMNFALPQANVQGTPKRGQKSSVTGLSKLKVGERTATQTQDLEEEPD